ncbi:hypothetical protein CASFOL_027465 [Castilleja foliolosa]|uniref:Uncharacterized protein n=1 Tax=Castilleja foliolosa TaxID=1961234 RepID=A0ABD3CGH2_9LAMI
MKEKDCSDENRAISKISNQIYTTHQNLYSCSLGKMDDARKLLEQMPSLWLERRLTTHAQMSLIRDIRPQAI